MNLVPGLRPIQEDRRRNVGTRREAARAREIAPEQAVQVGPLQPRAAPVDMYARPAAPVKDDSLDRLAAALAGVSQSMLGYMESTRGVREEDQQDRLLAAMAGQDQQGLQRVLEENPDARGRLGHRLVSAQIGRVAADDLARRAEELFETQFDKDNGDLDLWLREQAQMFAEANVDNPAVMAEFTRVWEPMTTRLKDRHAQWRAGRFNEATDSLISQTWLAGIEAGLAEGRDPAELYQDVIRGSYDTHRLLQGTDYNRLDGVLMGTIERLEQRALQDPERYLEYADMVNAILMQERVGGDGTKLGSFIDSEQGKRGAAILTRMTANGQKIMLERQAEEQMNNIETRLVSEAFNGTLHEFTTGPEADRTIIDANGNEKVLSTKELNDIAASAMIRRDQEQFGRDDDPEGVRRFNRHVDMFTRNPQLVHPEWEEVLGNGARAAFTVVEGDQIPPILLQATDLYSRLRARAPHQLSKYTDSRDRDFFEVVDTLHSIGLHGRDEGGRAAAIRAAVHAVRDPQRIAQVWDRYTKEDITRAREGTWGYFEGLFNGSSLAHARQFGDLMNDIEKSARMLSAATSMTPQQAMSRAAQRARENWRTVGTGENRTPIRVNAAYAPPNFDTLVENYRREWAERHGYDQRDVSLRSAPNTDNVWTITVEGMEAEEADGFLTMNMIYDMAGRERDQAMEAIVNDRERRRVREGQGRSRRLRTEQPTINQSQTE